MEKFEVSHTDLNNVTGGNAGKYVGPCKVYIVKEGDLLTSLAKKFNSTPEEIRALNGMDAEKSIRVGQKLLIPNRNYKG